MTKTNDFIESNNLAGWSNETRKFYDENLRPKIDDLFKVIKANRLCAVFHVQLNPNEPGATTAYKPDYCEPSEEILYMFAIARFGAQCGATEIVMHLLHESLERLNGGNNE